VNDQHARRMGERFKYFRPEFGLLVVHVWNIMRINA
jgi:hypothetical protein